MSTFIKFSFVVSLFAAASTSFAETSIEVPTTEVQAQQNDGSWRPDHILFGGMSAHYGGDGTKLNTKNPGLGVMWTGKTVRVLGKEFKNVAFSTGFYLNSETWDDEDHYTTYLAAHYLPWKFLGGDAGFTFGLAHGYKLAPVVPIVAPTVCWKYACVLVTPPFKESAGAVSLQFRLPL